MSILKWSVLLCAITLSGGTAFSADITTAKDYVAKIGLREEIRKFIGSKSKTLAPGKEQRIQDKINYAAIESAYAEALANRLSDEELFALLTSLSIPHLHDALKKQGLVVADCFKIIIKEIENATAKEN